VVNPGRAPLKKWGKRENVYEIIHLQRGVLYKSGVYVLKVTCLTPGDLSCHGMSRATKID